MSAFQTPEDHLAEGIVEAFKDEVNGNPFGIIGPMFAKMSPVTAAEVAAAVTMTLVNGFGVLDAENFLERLTEWRRANVKDED